MKNLQRAQIYMLLLLMILGRHVNAQDIVPYKDQMSEEQYQEMVQLEIEAKAEDDLFEKTIKYRLLGSKGTLLSDELGSVLFDRALEVATSIQHDSMMGVLKMSKGIVFTNRGKYDEARSILDDALQYWLGTTDSLMLANCYTYKAYLNRLEGSHFLAIKELYVAKELKGAILPLHQMSGITNRLMINYAEIGDLETAIDIGEEFIESAKDIDPRPNGYRTIVRNTGEYLLKVGHTERAKKYIEEALPSWMEGRIPKFLTSSFSVLSDLALAEGDFEQAKVYADSSLIYGEQFGGLSFVSEAHLRMATVLEQLDQPDDIEYHISKALDFAKASNQVNAIIPAAERASSFSAQKGDYVGAYKLSELVDSLRREVYSEEKSNNLRKFEKQRVADQSLEEIRLLSYQNELKAQNLEKESRLRKLLIGVLILALGSCALIFLLLRQRSQHNEVLEEKNETISKSLSEKELLLREIHHRVKNNLQFISSLLRLQSDHVDDPTALDALQQGHDRVRSMALIHQNLYKEENLTGVNTKAYFTKLITGLFKSNNIYEDRIRLDLDVSELNLDVDTIVPIGLITNELITNTLKYAFPDQKKGTVSVRLQEINNHLILDIQDDGVGMSVNQEGKLGDSFGYKLIRALVGQLDGTISIKKEKGTSVNISLKRYEVV